MMQKWRCLVRQRAAPSFSLGSEIGNGIVENIEEFTVTSRFGEHKDFTMNYENIIKEIGRDLLL